LARDLATPNYQRKEFLGHRLDGFVFRTLADDEDAVGLVGGHQIFQPTVHRRQDLLQVYAIAPLRNLVCKVAKHLDEEWIAQRLLRFVTQRDGHADGLAAAQPETAGSRVDHVPAALGDTGNLFPDRFVDQRTSGQRTRDRRGVNAGNFGDVRHFDVRRCTLPGHCRSLCADVCSVAVGTS